MTFPITFESFRYGTNLLAEMADEYAGIPCPIDGENLRIHKSYRFAEVFKKTEQQQDLAYDIVNQWPSREKGKQFVIIRYKDNGKLDWGFVPFLNRVTTQLSTLGITQAWDVDCEAKACEKLESLITPHALKCYMLTGSFLETSKRSKVIYMFRRLRPTLAISYASGEGRVLCGLCLHPIGYYSETWAGCMVPTDEVVAHLMLMRGDERLFWKQANQHPAWRPESGL